MTDPKRALKGMLARIFSDAVAEPHEREELAQAISSGALSQAEINEVIAEFIATTWKITKADGVISEIEKKRLLEIVDVLNLVKSELPAEWAALLD